MVVFKLTKEESEKLERELDAWWLEQDFNTKANIQRLVEGVKNPVDQNLPLEYADNHFEVVAGETKTIAITTLNPLMMIKPEPPRVKPKEPEPAEPVNKCLG